MDIRLIEHCIDDTYLKHSCFLEQPPVMGGFEENEVDLVKFESSILRLGSNLA